MTDEQVEQRFARRGHIQGADGGVVRRHEEVVIVDEAVRVTSTTQTRGWSCAEPERRGLLDPLQGTR